MYFPMDLKYNPTGKDDIDDERERRAERMAEMMSEMSSADSGESEEDEVFDATPSPDNCGKAERLPAFVYRL